MKITVICGTEKRGVTYRLRELFLEEFRGQAEIREFYLPGDGPSFCTGCMGCFLRDESVCRDAPCVRKIESALRWADVLVFASPVYVYHTTAAMKNLLDHLGWRWMIHRPHPSMFRKRAVILSQCIGGGAARAAGDIRDSLRWWGVSDILVFRCSLRGRAFWRDIPPEQQERLKEELHALARRAAEGSRGLPSPIVRARFYLCRRIMQARLRSDPRSADALYWEKQGWLGRRRPWKADGDSPGG